MISKGDLMLMIMEIATEMRMAPDKLVTILHEMNNIMCAMCEIMKIFVSHYIQICVNVIKRCFHI